MYNLHLFYF